MVRIQGIRPALFDDPANDDDGEGVWHWTTLSPSHQACIDDSIVAAYMQLPSAIINDGRLTHLYFMIIY